MGMTVGRSGVLGAASWARWRFLVGLGALAAGMMVGGDLVAPAAAQNPLARAMPRRPPFNCTGPEDACKQLSELLQTHESAFNQRDVATLTELYSDEAVILGEAPIVRGKEEIAQWFRAVFTAGITGRVDHLDQAHVEGDMAWWDGEWTATGPGANHSGVPYRGYWAEVLAREGGVWKIRMSTTTTRTTQP